MKLADALADVRLLGVDTAPFIYLIEQHPVYIDRVRAVFKLVSTGRPTVVTSVITLAEVLPVPLEKGQEHFARSYREMLLNTRYVLTRPVDAETAQAAAELRARYRLRTPDALQIATAVRAGCGAFLTNDHDLQRVADIRVIVLDNLELPEDETAPDK